jgi:hypothetical protein
MEGSLCSLPDTIFSSLASLIKLAGDALATDNRHGHLWLRRFRASPDALLVRGEGGDTPPSSCVLSVDPRPLPLVSSAATALSSSLSSAPLYSDVGDNWGCLSVRSGLYLFSFFLPAHGIRAGPACLKQRTRPIAVKKKKFQILLLVVVKM